MFTGKRRDDWPERMNFALQQHQTLPYIWGQSDCGIIFSDVVWAMTDVDPMEVFGQWHDQQSALMAVLRSGCRSVKDFLDQQHEQIPVAQARRGDAGYSSHFDTLTCPAIVVGAEAVSRDHTGWIHIPVSQLETVYRIG